LHIIIAVKALNIYIAALWRVLLCVMVETGVGESKSNFYPLWECFGNPMSLCLNVNKRIYTGGQKIGMCRISRR